MPRWLRSGALSKARCNTWLRLIGVVIEIAIEIGIGVGIVAHIADPDPDPDPDPDFDGEQVRASLHQPDHAFVGYF